MIAQGQLAVGSYFSRFSQLEWAVTEILYLFYSATPYRSSVQQQVRNLIQAFHAPYHGNLNSKGGQVETLAADIPLLYSLSFVIVFSMRLSRASVRIFA